MSEMPEWLREAFDGKSIPKKNIALRLAYDEIVRLQQIIDGRPAINAGLPETYIKWSQSIYELEFSRAHKPAH